MKYRIYFTLPDYSEDSVLIHGYSLEDVRDKANAEVKRRGGTNPWSMSVK